MSQPASHSAPGPGAKPAPESTSAPKVPLLLMPSPLSLGLAAAALALSLGSVLSPPLLPLLLALDGLVLLMMALDGLQALRGPAFEIGRQLPRRVPIGEEFEAVLSLKRVGEGAGPVAVVEDRHPQILGARGGEVGPVMLGQSQSLRLGARLEGRGSFAFGGVHLRSHSRLGLWIRQEAHPLEDEVLSIPRLGAPGEALAALRQAGFESRRRSRDRGQGTDFEGLRPYIPVYSLRDIDWRATARRGRPIVRQYTVDKNWDVLLAVDTGRLMGSRHGGRSKLDHAVEAVIALAHGAIVSGDRVGLVAFDGVIRGHLPCAKGPLGLRQMMSVASGLHSSTSATDFPGALAFLGSHHRKRSLIIMLTDFIDRDTARPMMEAMQVLARRHVCLFVAITDPEIESTLSHRAQTLGDLYESNVAWALRRERRHVLETLSRSGVAVLDLPPRALNAPMLNAYLNLRGR